MKGIINKGKKIMGIVLGIVLLFIVGIRLYNIKEVKEKTEKISIFEKKFHSYLKEQFKNQVDTVITKKYEKEIIEYAKVQGYRLDSRKKIKIGLGTDYILVFRKIIKVKIRKDWV